MVAVSAAVLIRRMENPANGIDLSGIRFAH